jgi:hypothetical protein
MIYLIILTTLILFSFIYSLCYYLNKINSDLIEIKENLDKIKYEILKEKYDYD